MTGSISLTLAERSGLGRCNVTRSDAIALDIGSTKFRADITGQHLEPAFGSRIGRYSFSPQFTHHGADIDDFSFSLGNHAGNNRLGHDKRCNEIDINDLTEVGFIHVTHGNPLDDAGIIDQDIDCPNAGVNIRYHIPYFLCIRHITDISFGINPFFGIGSHGRVQMLLTTAIKGNTGSGPGISSCNGKSDTV